MNAQGCGHELLECAPTWALLDQELGQTLPGASL